MLFAAHETTASAMALMMVSLARHRPWQDKVRAEIVAANPGDVEAVFRETLRLYSPIQLLPWVPFGRGRHMCMGTHFALMEVKAFLVALLRSFDLQLATTDEPAIQHLPVVRPKGRLRIAFVPRRGQ